MSTSKLTGLSICDTTHPVTTYAQLGGPGCVFNKALAIPMHLGVPWSSLEYVAIPGGQNGVGEHVQATDEIYFVISGSGTLITNGIAETINPGTLTIAPKGTRHALLNSSSTDLLSFLVVEVQADAGEQVGLKRPALTMNLLKSLHASNSSAHTIRQASYLISPSLAEVNLYDHFGGAWGTFSLLELPPSSRVEQYVEDEHDQLLFILHGYASIGIANDEHEDIRIESDNRAHQSVLIPSGVPRWFANRASGDSYPLLIARLNIRRPSRGERQVGHEA